MWVRRLYTGAGGRDLVAMDSRRRVFPGLLRRMLVLRDDVCATPWCEAPIVHADHATPVRDGGRTVWVNGDGRCARCNQGKEAPGWSVGVTHPGATPPTSASTAPYAAPTAEPGIRRRAARRPPPQRPREVEVVTPTGRTYRAQAPPLTGWGWQPPPAPRTRPRRRPRIASRLERHLIDVLAAAA